MEYKWSECKNSDCVASSLRSLCCFRSFVGLVSVSKVTGSSN
jgi:hypothetical protein